MQGGNTAWGELHLCKPPPILLGWTSAPHLNPQPHVALLPNLDSLVLPQGTGMVGRGVGVDEEEGVWVRHEGCQEEGSCIPERAPFSDGAHGQPGEGAGTGDV